MATYGKNNYPFCLAIPKATFIQTPSNGFLKGPETAFFNCTFHDKKFKVSFDQLGFRKTDIECETDATINDYWLLFNLKTRDGSLSCRIENAPKTENRPLSCVWLIPRSFLYQN